MLAHAIVVTATVEGSPAKGRRRQFATKTCATSIDLIALLPALACRERATCSLACKISCCLSSSSRHIAPIDSSAAGKLANFPRTPATGDGPFKAASGAAAECRGVEIDRLAGAGDRCRLFSRQSQPVGLCWANVDFATPSLSVSSLSPLIKPHADSDKWRRALRGSVGPLMLSSASAC